MLPQALANLTFASRAYGGLTEVHSLLKTKLQTRCLWSRNLTIYKSRMFITCRNGLF